MFCKSGKAFDLSAYSFWKAFQLPSTHNGLALAIHSVHERARALASGHTSIAGYAPQISIVRQHETGAATIISTSFCTAKEWATAKCTERLNGREGDTDSDTSRDHRRWISIFIRIQRPYYSFPRRLCLIKHSPKKKRIKIITQHDRTTHSKEM